MTEKKYNFTVPDICDEHSEEINIGNLFLKSYGGLDKFCGEIRTAQCEHSNSIVKEMVHEDGRGKVLFINHTGSELCSMVGDQIAQQAYKNNFNWIYFPSKILKRSDEIFHIWEKAGVVRTFPKLCRLWFLLLYKL